MKFKLLTALLGLMMAIPGAVYAQSSDDQMNDQYAKPSPNVQMQAPSGDSSMDQDQGSGQRLSDGSIDNGSASEGPMDPNNSSADANQSYSGSAPEENRGVARVSLIKGDVSTQRGDNGIWSAAALNAPLLAGDRVSTGDKARAEFQLDYANMFRLAEHSQANITQLTRSQIQIQVSRGMANYTVFKNSDADAEIDTPNVAVRTARRESSFRILVTADDHTEILVRKGEVEVTTPQGGTRVTAGQFITVQGAGDQAQYKIGEAPARDDWDQWNTDRDTMIHNSVSRRNTNDYYVGTEDLDSHGTWSEVPDYGRVWRPAETDPDWAPYRNGRWVYEPYWGWTWVPYESWGWAPYHYGRWMYLDSGWAWWPGPVYGYPYYRPIWAPAYVSFFGWGGGFGFGWGGGWGSVGWLPLGPCDHFHPWWGRWGGRFGEGRFAEHNRGGFAPLHGGARFSNVNLALHDQHFRGATSVSGGQFGRGQVRGRAMDHSQFQNARFSTGRVPVNPSHESFSASGRAAAPSTMRNLSSNQHFFSSRGNVMAPTRQQGGSFANRGEGIGNRPSNGFQHFGGQNNVGQSRSTGPVNKGGRETGNSGGWQKFSQMPPQRGQVRAPEPMGRPSMGAPENRGSFNPNGSRGTVPETRGYSPQSRGYTPESRGYNPQSRIYSPESRGYGAGNSRPPLNMRQPIVTPRSYGGGPYGGGRGGYGGGARQAPSYGGGHSAPSYGGGGGGHSAPSSHGGGSPHGGGGGSSHSGGGGRHGR